MPGHPRAAIQPVQTVVSNLSPSEEQHLKLNSDVRIHSHVCVWVRKSTHGEPGLFCFVLFYFWPSVFLLRQLLGITDWP